MNELKYRLINVVLTLSLLLNPVFTFLSFRGASAAPYTAYTAYKGGSPQNNEVAFSQTPRSSPTDTNAPQNEGFWADLDGDHDVDGLDLAEIAGHWDCTIGQPCYQPLYDRDSDGDVDFLDLATLGNEYDVDSPVITILSPQEGDVVGHTTLMVTGTITDSHEIAFVTINGVTATLSTGLFNVTVPITAGNQTLSVVAADELGLNGGVARVIFADQAGPFIRVNEPADRQSVYTLRPTIAISYTDFYTSVAPATLLVQLADDDGTISDLTDDMTKKDDEATGIPSFDLFENKAYTLTVSLQDNLGNLNSVQTTFFVPEDAAGITPPEEPDDVGWVSGVIYDSSTCDQFLTNCLGLAGAQVTLARVNEGTLNLARTMRAQQLETLGASAPLYPTMPDGRSVPTFTIPVSGTIVTGPDGFFAFPVGDTARYVLRVEKFGFTYGQRIAEIVRGHSAPVNEIYLTPIDTGMTSCDEFGCHHTSDDGQMMVDIPAGAIPPGEVITVTATEFDRVNFLPSGELPPGTWETYAFNLGGDSDYAFLQPITVSLKNSKGFDPGSEIPLGFWNQHTLEWEHEGVAAVDPSGEWVIMQVTHFSNHDPNYPMSRSSTNSDGEDNTEDDDPCAKKKKGNSEVLVRSGALNQEFSLPPVQVFDGAMAPTFKYSSDRAAPSELIELDLSLEPAPGIELLDFVQIELFIEGEKTDNFTFSAGELREGGEIGNFRFLWDGHDAQGNQLPAGIYRYAARVSIPYRAQFYASLNNQFGGPPDYTRPTGRYTTATAEQWVYGSVALNTDLDGFFGAGWALDGLQRLYEDEAGRIMISDGCAVDEYYFPGKNLLLEGAQGGKLASYEVTGLHGMYVEEVGEQLSVVSDQGMVNNDQSAVISDQLSVISEETQETGSDNSTAGLEDAKITMSESNPEVRPEEDMEDQTTSDPPVDEGGSVLIKQDTSEDALPIGDESTSDPPLNEAYEDNAEELPDEIAEVDEVSPQIVIVEPVVTPNPSQNDSDSAQKELANTQLKKTLLISLTVPPVTYLFTGADTNVSGSIITHTTWTITGSPYILTSDVVVNPGITLTIEPGVTVKGENEVQLRVQGRLLAIGSQPITFTSDLDSGPVQWKGLVFDGEEATGYLKNVTVRYAGDYNGYARSNITVRNVLIGEVRIESSQILHENDEYHNQSDYGIYVVNSHVVVSDTLFSGNGNNTQDYALYATGANSVITVASSTFTNNNGWAVRVDADDAHRVTSNTFGGNGLDRVLLNSGNVAPGAILAPQNGMDGYELGGDITVPAGITLTLQPGSVIMGQQDSRLYVQGHLQAVGSQPITFTSSADSGYYQWEGLVFDGSAASGYLKYVTVRYAGDYNDIVRANITIRDVSTGVRIESSQILDEHDQYSNQPDYGLYVANSRVAVSDTLFSGNGNNASDWPIRLEAEDLHMIQLAGNTFDTNSNNRVLIIGGTLSDNSLLSPQNGLEGYVMAGDITVPSGVTLTVEANSVIMGQNEVSLNIEGYLQATGTPTMPITFTSETNSDANQWEGLVFNGAEAGGYLKHATVRYGGDYDDYVRSNITVRNVFTREVRIESSSILSEHDEYHSQPDYGLYIADSRVVVSGTMFSGNGNNTSDYALYAVGASTVLTVSASTFASNSGYAGHVDADSLHQTWLIGNTFSSNGKDRIMVDGGSIIGEAILPAQQGLKGYELDEDVTVSSGVILTITPDSSVMGQEEVSLIVMGYLYAVGTPSLPITFTSATDSEANQWEGLVFNGAEAGGYLKHTTVHYGGDYNDYARSNITVRNVITGEVRIESSKILSEHDEYHNQPDYGLYVVNSRAVVSDTRFSSNGNNTSDYAFYAAGAKTIITVTGNTFENNNGWAIRVEPDDAHRVINNTFSGNGLNRILINSGYVAPGSTLAPQTGLEGYELGGDLTVPAGITLTLEPGSAIMGQQNARLYVQGHLQAVGSQPITFTSSADSGPNQWEGLVFDGSEASGNLKHVTVRYAGDYNDIVRANITVRDGTAGVRIESSQILVEHDQYNNQPDYGLYVSNSRVVVSDTLFSNIGNNSSDYALYATGANTAITVTGSTFENNPGWAIRVEADDGHRMMNNTFNGNGLNRILINSGNIAPGSTLAPQTGLEGYELGGNLTVPAGITLTIEPGSVIMGRHNARLYIQGHLQAVGSQPITFTSSTDSGPYQWAGLVFDGSDASGDLKHVIVRYAGDHNDIVRANITVRNGIAGVRIESSQILDEHDRYNNKPDYGLYVANSRVVVSDTLFSNNGNNSSDYALYATGANTAITVTDSTFENNPGWAIRVEADDGHRMMNNTFNGNGLNRILINSGNIAPGSTLAPQTGLEGYELDGDLTVPAGITLTLEPGSAIMGQQNARLYVQGHLQAVGSQPITFTSSADSGHYQWEGLVFDGPEASGYLKHVTVRYAGDHNEIVRANITVRDVITGVRIESSQIIEEHDQYSNQADYGLYVANSRVVVSDTLFSGIGNNASDWPIRLEAEDLHRIQLAGNTFDSNSNNRVLIIAGSLRDHSLLRPQIGLQGYELSADLTVPAGITLTIEPGTAVMGRQGARLYVQGRLQAIGSRPITFTSSIDNGPFQWEGLVFDGGEASGVLKHVTVRYGGDHNEIVRANITVRDVLTGEVRIVSSQILEVRDKYNNQPDYGLYVANSRVVVSDTLFSTNGNNFNDYALYATGDNSSLTVSESVFQFNAGYPLRIPTDAISQIRDNIFIDNGYDRVSLYGDKTITEDSTLAPQSNISGYEFEGSMVITAGVTLTVAPGTSLYWNLNQGLTVHGTLDAIGTEEVPITFTSSTDSGPGQWVGILFRDGIGVLEYARIRYASTGLEVYDSQVSVRYANIENNSWAGAYLRGEGSAFSIIGSKINGNGSWGIYNQTGSLIDARYNWWGHPSGPYHPDLNPSGLGDQVSENVLFEPWIEQDVQDLGINNQTATDHSTLTYDPSNDTYTRHYPGGTEAHFNSDGTHDYTLDPSGTKTTYSYNPDGSLAAIGVIPPGETTPRWTWAFNYTGGQRSALSSQRSLTITDPAGRDTVLEIDEHGDLVKIERPGFFEPRSFTYNADHLMTHKQDEGGYLTTYVYDHYGRLNRVELPPRQIYDADTGEVTTFQETRNFTPSDVSYQLVNNMIPGTPISPTSSLVTSTLLLDVVDLGRGGFQGHTNMWGSYTDYTDALGRTTHYQRDSANNVTREITPDGNCFVYTYDDSGNVLTELRMTADQCTSLPAELSASLIKQMASQAPTWTFTHEPRFNRIKTSTDPLGNTTTYTYDYEEDTGNTGNLIRMEKPQVEDEFGVVVTPTVYYTYNAWGQLERQTDERGVVTMYVYTQGTPDEASGGSNPLFAPGVSPVPGLKTQQILDYGDSTHLNVTTTYKDFGGAGNPMTTIHPNGSSTQFTYDSWGRELTRTDALNIVTKNVYNASGELVQIIEDYTPDGVTGRNVITTFIYDSHYRLLSQRTIADGITRQTINTYDINGNLATQTDSNGHTIINTFDDSNQPIAQTDPLSHTLAYEYNGRGNLSSIQAPDGSVHNIEYDHMGRVISETVDADGLHLVTTYTYDMNSNLSSETDPSGLVTCYTYDALNRRTSETLDCGGMDLTTTYVYDVAGNQFRVTNERGLVTHYSYDALNRTASKRLVGQKFDLETAYKYDVVNNLVQVTDERGTINTFVYDPLNRKTAENLDANGLNLSTIYTYDRLGNPYTETDANGIKTLTEYNAFDIITRRVDDHGGLNAETLFTYDNNLNLVGTMDANGHATDHVYNPRNELVRTSYADGSMVEFSYNPNRKLAAITDQSGAQVDYTYDGANRLVSKNYQDGSAQNFEFDPTGRQTYAQQIMNGHTTQITSTYNILGDVTLMMQTTDDNNWATIYSYDYLSGTKTMIYPSGTVVTYTLDMLARVTAVNQDDSAAADYTYDDILGTTSHTHSNGILTQIESDPLNRITRVSSAVADYFYGYDNAGNRLFMQRNHKDGQPADVYRYDGIYQITQVWYGADATNPTQISAQEQLQQYDLDPVHNRLEVVTDGTSQLYQPNNGFHLTDPMNRYQQIDISPISYDARGSLLNDGVNTYTYDYKNRQISMVGPLGTAEYIYDSMGRRVAKIVNGVTTYFVYDNNNQVIEERDGGDQLITRYVYGSVIDEPLSMERGGTTYTYHRDAQGSITEVTEETGTLIERYKYDIYGQVYIFDGTGNPLTASAIENPYFYTGRRFDVESGNYYFRARMYSPWMGRFLQMDPLGTVDGMNLYANYFVVNGTDPNGTDLWITNTPGADGLHQRVCATTWDKSCKKKTGKFCVGFYPTDPSNLFDWTPGCSNGKVQDDTNARATSGYNNPRVKTDCCTSRDIVKYLKRQVGKHHTYNLVFHNCRDYASNLYSSAKLKFDVFDMRDAWKHSIALEK